MKKRLAILMATTMMISGSVLAYADTAPTGQMPPMGEGMEGQMPPMGEGMEGMERPEMGEGMERPEMGEGMEGMERPEMGEGMQGQMPEAEVNPATATATPSNMNLLVNGSAVAVDAYMINGNNYIKLRDLAYMINNTTKNFAVGWNAEANAIELTSNAVYEVAGGEMTLGTGAAKTANLSQSTIYVDGRIVPLVAYTIEGSNYFKLRDVMEVFNVYVGWDADTSTVTLDTSMDSETTSTLMTPPMGEGMEGGMPPMGEGMEGGMPPMGEGMEGERPPLDEGMLPEELADELVTDEEVTDEAEDEEAEADDDEETEE
ncbi:MAG: stalk domain-containing protein [Bacillota bacterium]